MREIKFRVWDKKENEMFYSNMYQNKTSMIYGLGNFLKECSDIEEPIMQYTGLKDKNGLTKIYEGDIIDENGLVKGNIYEINEMDKRETDTVIQGFGTKTWCETVSRAILLGCRYSE